MASEDLKQLADRAVAEISATADEAALGRDSSARCG